MTAIRALLRRDLLLLIRQRGELALPLIFMVLVVSLFPLGIGPGPELLARIAPGVIWIAALLSALLTLDTIFRADFDDGSLDQYLVAGVSLPAVALAKAFAHWLATGLPIVLLAPLLGIWLQLPGNAILALVESLLLGTPVLSLMGGVGVALTVSLRRGGQLLALLIFPLLVPVLVFGTGAVDSAALGLPVQQQLLLLAALLIFSISTAPFAMAAALRISLS